MSYGNEVFRFLLVRSPDEMKTADTLDLDAAAGIPDPPDSGGVDTETDAGNLGEPDSGNLGEPPEGELPARKLAQMYVAIAAALPADGDELRARLRPVFTSSASRQPPSKSGVDDTSDTVSDHDVANILSRIDSASTRIAAQLRDMSGEPGTTRLQLEAARALRVAVLAREAFSAKEPLGKDAIRKLLHRPITHIPRRRLTTSDLVGHTKELVSFAAGSRGQPFKRDDERDAEIEKWIRRAAKGSEDRDREMLTGTVLALKPVAAALTSSLRGDELSIRDLRAAVAILGRAASGTVTRPKPDTHNALLQPPPASTLVGRIATAFGKRKVAPPPEPPEPQPPVVVSDIAVGLLPTALRQRVKDMIVAGETSLAAARAIVEGMHAVALRSQVLKPNPRPILRSVYYTQPMPRMLFATASDTGPWPTTAARASHVGDLVVVRQERVKYKPSEVAEISNIMAHEFLERRHRRTHTTEESLTSEQETEQETQRDLQTAEKFELQRETQETIRSRSELKAGLKVSAQYGPTVKAEAEMGYTSSTETERTQRSASRFAREVTEHSVERIKERLKETRFARTVDEVEENNTHQIDNKQGVNQSSVYRWVDKVYEMQAYNYGIRLMLEVIVPEPAAVLRFLDKAPLEVTAPKPAPIDGLSIADITETNYLELVQTWNATDVPTPPPAIVVVPTAVKYAPSSDITVIALNSEAGRLKVPDGYEAWFYFATASSSEYSWGGEKYLGFTVTVGNAAGIVSGGIPSWIRYQGTFDSVGGPFGRGELGFTWVVTHNRAVAVDLSLYCRRQDDAMDRWRLQVYGALQEAYTRQKAVYDEQMANARASAGGVNGRNPATNRRLERAELKRGSIEVLSSANFLASGSLTVTDDSLPQINFGENDATAERQAFFETAFEWEQMTFESLPYFWADPGRWQDLILASDPDPMYAEFLSAGAASVSVPVVPGYEAAALYFLDNKNIWNEAGEPPVSVERMPLLAALQAAEPLRRGGPPERTGDPWRVRIPTELVILDLQELPDRWITLGP